MKAKGRSEVRLDPAPINISCCILATGGHFSVGEEHFWVAEKGIMIFSRAGFMERVNLTWARSGGSSMSKVEEHALPLALIVMTTLGGCGLFVPEKDLFAGENHDPGLPSAQGVLENTIVGHIHCELRDGLMEVLAIRTTNGSLDWLNKWGAQVTLKIQVEEQSAVNPGVSLLTPLENSVKAFPVGGSVVSGQNVSIGLGLSGTAHATRVETISFTLTFKDLKLEAQTDAAKGIRSCDIYKNGVMLQSDLKIRQFLYDKAFIATTGEATSVNLPGLKKTKVVSPYTTFTEDITFVASYGGSVTPMWKFATIAIDPSSNMASATRTHTNDVLITLGPVAKPADPALKTAAQLSDEAKSVHDAQLIGTFTGSSNQSSMH
ncbi:MAG: hypothetical protein ACLPKB_33670 [Xanthobacteraceae bacterium]